jgi:hypothetical protein
MKARRHKRRAVRRAILSARLRFITSPPQILLMQHEVLRLIGSIDRQLAAETGGRIAIEKPRRYGVTR